MTELKEVREGIREAYKHHSWVDWECDCEVCQDRQKDGIDAILAFLHSQGIRLPDGNEVTNDSKT